MDGECFQGRVKNGRGLTRVVAREVERILSRRLYLCLGLALPLVGFALFTALFIGGIVTDLPVAVLDRDHSALSRSVIRMADATQGMAVVAQVADETQGKRGILSGRYHGLLVLPRDMEKDILRGRSVVPTFYYNNQLYLVGSSLKRAMGKVGGTVSAGVDMARRMKTGEGRAAAVVHMDPVGVDTRILFNPHLNYTHYLYLALLPAMLMIFAMGQTLHALGIERKEDTLDEWLDIAGGSPVTALVGKLLPHTLILILSGAAMEIFTFGLMGIPLNGSPGFILFSTLVFILACQGAALFIFCLLKDMDTCVGLTSAYSASAFAFAGVTFPAMGMPQWAQGYSAALPLPHYIHIIVGQSLKGADILHSMAGFKALLIFALALPLVSLVLVRLPGGIFAQKRKIHHV